MAGQGMDGKAAGQMGGAQVGEVDGQVERWWVDEQTGGRMDGQTHSWLAGWTKGRAGR